MERSYCRLVVIVDGRRALQTNKKGFLYHLDDEIMENWIIFHKKEAAVNKKKWRKKGCKVAWQKKNMGARNTKKGGGFFVAFRIYRSVCRHHLERTVTHKKGDLFFQRLTPVGLWCKVE